MMKLLGRAMLLFAMLTAHPQAQAAPPDVIGEWTLTTISPVGENSNTVEFRKVDDTLKAFAKGPQGERPYDSMKLEGTTLTLVITVDYQGAPMVITYSGTVADTSINGSADFGGMAMGSFSATRKESAKP